MEDLSDASFSMRPVSYQGKQAISSSQNFLLYNRVDNVSEILNRVSLGRPTAESK
jgi:hypothetical protein